MKNSIGGSNPTILATEAQRMQQHLRDNPEGDMPKHSGSKRILGASSGSNLFFLEIMKKNSKKKENLYFEKKILNLENFSNFFFLICPRIFLYFLESA